MISFNENFDYEKRGDVDSTALPSKTQQPSLSIIQPGVS